MATPPILDPADHQFQGAISFTGSVSLPAAVVTDAAVATGANIAGTKLVHYVHATHHQAGTVAAKTEQIFLAYKAGTLYSLAASIDTAITGDNTVVIDVKKSTAGGAWSSVLSGTTTFNSSTVARTPAALSISGTPTFIANDMLQVIVTVAGSGTQATGLIVRAVVAENGT